MATPEDRILRRLREQRRQRGARPSQPEDISNIPTLRDAAPTQPSGRSAGLNERRTARTTEQPEQPNTGPPPATEPEIADAPTQPRGRNETLRGLSEPALNLDLAEVRARRAAGEENPIGSAELRAREQGSGSLPRDLQSFESLRDNDPSFRFASRRGEAGEPVFDNDSIRRVEEAGLPGLSVIENTNPISADQRISDRLALGLISEEDARQQRQRLTDQATNRTNQAEILQADAASRREANLERESDSGLFIRNRQGDVAFNPRASTADIADEAEALAPTFQGVASDLGIEPGAMAGRFQSFGLNSRNTEPNFPVNESTFRDAFLLDEALAANSDLNPSSDFNTSFDNAIELVANQEGTLFGGAKSTVAGERIDLDDLPDSVQGRLDRIRQQVFEQFEGDVETDVGRKVNATLVNDLADSLTPLRNALIENAPGPRGRSRVSQQAPGAEARQRVKELQTQAANLSQRIRNGSAGPEDIANFEDIVDAEEEQMRAELQRTQNESLR